MIGGCKHEDFKAKVGVARLEDTGGFMAEITITCAQCGLPFHFLGLDAGVDTQGAKVSVDGKEARIAIVPEGTQTSPLQRISFGVSKFDG